ncbi:MAG TPA: tail fiber domain-containing protein [Flavitalea sp.]|nr:tail fiber domain-containing protein [Flavitalea sp.]
MNKRSFSWVITCVLLLSITGVRAQAVSINDDASLPHPSAILDVKVAAAVKKGVLFPRMTAAQRAAIPSPAKGLLVYDSTNNSFWYHNGAIWQQISSGGANSWTVLGTNIYNNNSGNVGIGVTTPKAKLNVAKSQTVLFGDKFDGLGVKAFWLPAKAAFRAGEVVDVYGTGAPYLWDNANIGYGSFAAGSDAKASGDYAVALGWTVSATGRASFATGVSTSATGYYAAVFGEYGSAQGFASFSANSGNVFGDFSAAFNSSSVGGENSFGAGYQSESTGAFSAIFGNYTINRTRDALVIGEYNNPIIGEGLIGTTATSPLFIIGNGTNFDARRNAFVTLRNGTTGINKNPAFSVASDGLLQLKQISGKHALTLEAPTTTNKWSFNVASDMTIFYNNALRGTFNSVTGNYMPFSDKRLKKDINALAPVLENVMQLKTYTYHLLDNDESDMLSYGLMAQEVKEVFPDAVSSVEANDGTKYFALNYNSFNVIAIKAIQEQQAKIDDQGKSITELKEMILALQKELASMKQQQANSNKK